MAYNYTTVQTFIQEKLLPAMHDNIFTANHYLLRLLKDKAKTYNQRQIQVPLEYAKLGNIKFMSRSETITLETEEIATKAQYNPRMLAGSITIEKEDELENLSDMAIGNILKAKVKNLQKAIEENLAAHIWLRGETLTATKNWNTIDFLVNANATSDVGNIIDDTNVPSWWKSKVISPSDFSDSPAVEANLVDKNKDCFVVKILQRLVAKARYQTGQNPDVIVCPQYVWDLFESVYEPRKTGDRIAQKIADMGFNSLIFRGTIPVVADADMVAKQVATDSTTGSDVDTDGRIYALNTKHLYMFLNSQAKFTIQEFIKPANQLTRSALVLAYGNLAISNRRTQVYAKGIASPQSYET